MQSSERLLMFIFTGLSNFWCFPCLYLIYKRKMVFGFMLGSFTFLCSLIYHSMDSLEIHEMYLTASDWHRLDNIGSIMSLIYLFVFLMDNLDRDGDIYISCYESNTDRVLLYLGLFITLLMQTKHPWDLENTLIPILLYGVVLILKVLLVRRPRIIRQNFSKACSILGFGFYCFNKGLDDANDYLRMWHGIWHFCGSASLFYFYQSVPKDKPLKMIHFEPGPNYPTYGFWRTLVYVYSCGLYMKP
jgi:hypothetical protein